MNVSPRGVGYSNVVNDRDHGALARIAAAFCTMMTLLFFMERLLIRWPWHSLFRKDDFMALGATVSVLQLRFKGNAITEHAPAPLDGADIRHYICRGRWFGKNASGCHAPGSSKGRSSIHGDAIKFRLTVVANKL